MNHTSRSVLHPFALVALGALVLGASSCASEGSTLPGDSDGDGVVDTVNNNPMTGNGGAGPATPNGGAGTVTPNGGAGTVTPNGGAGTVTPNGGAGTVTPNGGASTGGASTGGASTGGASTGGASTGGASTGGTGPMEPVLPPCPDAPKRCHEFIAADNQRTRLLYVNQFTKATWTVQVNNGDTSVNTPRSLEKVGPDAVLVGHDKGAFEYKISDGTKLPFSVDRYDNITGAVRLPNRDTFLAGQGGTAYLVDANGAQKSTITVNTNGDSRVWNRHPETGNLYFSKLREIFEINPTNGQEVWRAQIPGNSTKGYAVIPRPGAGSGEGVWATNGDQGQVLEIDGSGQVLKTLGGRAMHPFMDFTSGFRILEHPDGTQSVVVTNWLGHQGNPDPDLPHLLEFDVETNAELWRWGTQTEARQITNMLVLDYMKD